MKPVHKNHLGINHLTGTVHVDNWNGKMDFDYEVELRTYCGVYPDNYSIISSDNIDDYPI